MSYCHPDSFASTFFTKLARASTDRYQSPTYQQRRQLVGETIRKEVLRLGRSAMTIRLLDFGCGTGKIARDAVALGLQVTGVDNSQAMIDAAREQLSGFGTQTNLEWLQSSSGEGKYEERCYDIVLCLSVLEFVPDIHSLLSRLSARVGAGGLLVVSVPNRRSWLRAIEKFVYRHPQPFRQFSMLNHLTGSDSYLDLQAHQLSRCELLEIITEKGLREEACCFHAAPAFIRSVDRLENVGMMLMMTLRKGYS